jgi:hypothetical protein
MTQTLYAHMKKKKEQTAKNVGNDAGKMDPYTLFGKLGINV